MEVALGHLPARHHRAQAMTRIVGSVRNRAFEQRDRVRGFLCRYQCPIAQISAHDTARQMNPAASIRMVAGGARRHQRSRASRYLHSLYVATRQEDRLAVRKRGVRGSGYGSPRGRHATIRWSGVLRRLGATGYEERGKDARGPLPAGPGWRSGMGLRHPSIPSCRHRAERSQPRGRKNSTPPNTFQLSEIRPVPEWKAVEIKYTRRAK